jgi:hypothetical protein
MNTTNNMQYGVIYIKVCPERSATWLKHCHILSSTPMSFQQNVKEIANDINSKYKAYGDSYKDGRLKFLESILDKYPHNTENLLKLVDWVKNNY